MQITIDRSGTEQTVTLKPTAMGIGLHPATFLANAPVVHDVLPKSAAAAAGIAAGDRVVRIAGQPIDYWDEMTLAVGRGRSLWFWMWAQRTWQGHFATTAAYLRGGPLPLEIQRDGSLRTVSVEPTYDAKAERYLLGVTFDREAALADVPMVVRRYGFGESIVRGEQEIWRLMRVTGEFLGRLVKAPEQHYESLGGPVRIISMFAKIAQEGVAPFLYFLCFFSLQLGMLNLLPIPILDGGHIVFLTIEAIRRKPLTVKVQSIAQHVGLAMLLSVFVIVTINDLGHFAWIRKLVGKLF